MKHITSLVVVMILTLTVVSIATADFKAITVFNNTSSAGTVYSTPVNVRSALNKSIQVTGVDQTTLAAAALDGTFLLQCGPTSTGPWVTCKDQGANAVTTTANAAFNLNNAVLWIRASWARTSGRVKAWLTY